MSKKVTLPVGVPATVELTVAVKVTLTPAFTLPFDAVSPSACTRVSDRLRANGLPPAFDVVSTIELAALPAEATTCVRLRDGEAAKLVSP